MAKVPASVVKHAKALGLDLDRCNIEGKTLAESEKEKDRIEKPLDRMNKLERHYSWFLDAQQKAGIVLWYRFGEVKLRLADKTWYTVDFQVRLATGMTAMVETKGWCRDDAAVKFKVAAENYPEYAWMMIGREKTNWRVMRGQPLAVLIP